VRDTLHDQAPKASRRRRRSIAGALAGSACLAVTVFAAPLAGGGAGAATKASTHPAASQTPHVAINSPRLVRIGKVNLEQAIGKYAPPAASRTGATRHVVPLGRVPRRSDASAPRTALPRATSLAGFTGNVAGEHGFDGITALMNGGANSPDAGGVGDVSPPDQGLAVGPSPMGTVLVEFVNDTLNIYNTSGQTLLGAVPAYDLFGLAPSTFLSDPRAYWDPSTGHWFFTMFQVGTPDGSVPSLQFIAVSTTTNPFGSYTIFAINTTDASNTAGACPCFGDFDQVGADKSGFFIATNEFSVVNGEFNGAVIYALSKGGLISAANGGKMPTLETFTDPFTSDPYAGYHLSPSTITEGSNLVDTEYFVESNANLPNNVTTKGLEVFALLHTNRLNRGAPLTMVEKTITSESYTEQPPNAIQKSGPTPLGTSVGFSGTAQLETDFNAVQEVTYASGNLYAELTTGFAYGTGENAGAAWFVLRPSISSGKLSATMVKQGYVETSQNLLYPVIGVNASGVGFISFAVAGPDRYPSAAYATFSAATGAGSVVHVAANGVAPLDDFTCYPPFSGGTCRYGDYSMAQYYNGDIYMANEYVGPEARDTYSNWGTRVYWAPVSAG